MPCRAINSREMPAANKQMHEAFCQLVARGASGAEAVRQAGYTTKAPRNTAVELNKRPEIKARIAELRAEYIAAAAKANAKANAPANAVALVGELEARRDTARTGEAVLHHLWEQVERAYAAGNIPAGTKALELLAKHHGLLIERTMAVKSPLDDLSADQLAALLRLAERISAPRPVTIETKPRPPTIEGEADDAGA